MGTDNRPRAVFSRGMVNPSDAIVTMNLLLSGSDHLADLLSRN